MYIGLEVGGGYYVYARPVSKFLPGSFKAEFHQIHKSSITGKEKKSKGSLDYKYPSHIRFETTYPDNIVFVSNPEKTWYYTAPFMEGEPGELTVSKSNRNSLVKFFDLLKKGLRTNKMYSVTKNKKGNLIKFNEKNKRDMGITSAQLSFQGASDFKNISEVHLIKTDKTQVHLQFKKVQPGLTFKSSHFVFKAPKNTRTSN